MTVPAPLSFEQDIHELESELARLEELPEGAAPDTAEQLRRVRRELAALKRERYANLTPWDTVQVARHPGRPQTLDYIELMCDQAEFVELHGDRAFGDDRAIRTGFARIDGQRLLLVGHQKGKTLAERRSTGSPSCASSTRRGPSRGSGPRSGGRPSSSPTISSRCSGSRRRSCAS
jgi:acetyl-CoA carboxylase carboxyl transferase subunit alpha